MSDLYHANWNFFSPSLSQRFARNLYCWLRCYLIVGYLVRDKKKLKVVFEIFLIVCALFTDDCGSWLQWPVICDMKKKEFNVCKTTHCDPLCRPNTLGLSVPCRWQRFSTLPLLIWNATVPDSRSSQDGEREREGESETWRRREGGKEEGSKEARKELALVLCILEEH